MLIKQTNPNTSRVPKSYLAVNQAIGVGTIYLKNTNGFNANGAIQIGETGDPQSEIVLANASAPSGTQILLTGTTVNEHPADTPLYAIKFNQVVFEKSTTGTTGTPSPLTNGTVSITPNLAYTAFDDTTAGTGDAYQTFFLNSVTLGSTALSSWQTQAGYSFYSLASITQRVRDKLWSSNYIKDDNVIRDWVNEWRDIMANAVISINEDYHLGTVNIAFGTDGLGTINDISFANIRRVWATFDGVNFYASTKMQYNDFRPDESFVTNHPYHAWQGDTTLLIQPASNGGTMQIAYYRFGTTLVNDTDVLPQPMRPYTDTFVGYALSQALFQDQKMELYQAKYGEVQQGKKEFIDNIVYRDRTGPSYISIVEDVDGYDGMPL